MPDYEHEAEFAALMNTALSDNMGLTTFAAQAALVSGAQTAPS